MLRTGPPAATLIGFMFSCSGFVFPSLLRPPIFGGGGAGYVSRHTPAVGSGGGLVVAPATYAYIPFEYFHRGIARNFDRCAGKSDSY